jgi:hypothetical protein
MAVKDEFDDERLEQLIADSRKLRALVRQEVKRSQVILEITEETYSCSIAIGSKLKTPEQAQ